MTGRPAYVNVRVHVGLSYVLGNRIWNCTFPTVLSRLCHTSTVTHGDYLVCLILVISVYKSDNHGLTRTEIPRSKVHKDVIFQR